VLGNGLRLAGVAMFGFVRERSLAAFAGVWALSRVCQYLAVQVLGWRAAFSHIGRHHLRVRVLLRRVGEEHAGVWHFMHVF